MDRTLFLGLDVHKYSISVAVAEDTQPLAAPTIIAIVLRHPIADCLGGCLELPRQLLNTAAGAYELDHLAAELGG